MTHPSSHGLTVEACGQGGMVDDWQELRTNATQASRNVSDPHERTAQAIIPLERAGEYTVRNPTTFAPTSLAYIPSPTACTGTAAPVNGQLWEASSPATHHMAGGKDLWMYAEFYVSYATMHRGSQDICSHAAHLSASTTLPQLLAVGDMGTDSKGWAKTLYRFHTRHHSLTILDW